MKTLLPLCWLAVTSFAATDSKPYCLNDPSSSDRLLVVQEFREGDDLPWDVDHGNHLDVLKTDTGEVFRPDVMFTPKVVLPGDLDPRDGRGAKVPEGLHLLVWELARPTQKWSSIQRLAGHYELTHGGETRWVDVPLMLEQGADPIDWEDETLEEAGFKLKARIEGLRMLQVQITERPWEFDEAVLLDEDDKEFAYQGSSTTGDVWTQSFEIGDRELEGLRLVVRMDDGTEHTLDKFSEGAKYKRAKGSSWKKAGLQLETRVAVVPRFSAKGTGNFDLYRKYRWLDAKGRALDLWPRSSASGGGKAFATDCMVPSELPKGARLELGLLVGAKTEKLLYEHLDIPAPR
ncbi:MAG: hypothetical protein ISQ08_03020 [Planctomycetes bacterium]|nr:hypothetical protein [Planctomycetota bacterium]